MRIIITVEKVMDVNPDFDIKELGYVFTQMECLDIEQRYSVEVDGKKATYTTVATRVDVQKYLNPQLSLPFNQVN